MSSQIKHFRNQTRHFGSRSTHRFGYTLYRPVFNSSRSPRQPPFYLQGWPRLGPRQRLARSPVVRQIVAGRADGSSHYANRAPSRLPGRTPPAQPYPIASALAVPVQLGVLCRVYAASAAWLAWSAPAFPCIRRVSCCKRTGSVPAPRAFHQNPTKRVNKPASSAPRTLCALQREVLIGRRIWGTPLSTRTRIHRPAVPQH
jgi:hypothetical protein